MPKKEETIEDELTAEDLIDEVMGVIAVMTEDDRVALFEEIAESYDLDTGEALDEDDDGGDEDGPDGDPSDEDDEDDEDDEETEGVDTSVD